MPERRKPGMPSRGDRKPIITRVPTDQAAHYEQCALALGLPLSDYVALCLAELHGKPVPSYIKVRKPDGSHQEELRISA